MKSKILSTALIGGFLITSQMAFATPSADTSNTESRVYAGLVFDLDGSDGFVPDLIVGFRSVRVKSNDNVEGADLSARASFGKNNKSVVLAS